MGVVSRRVTAESALKENFMNSSLTEREKSKVAKYNFLSLL